MPVCFLLPPYPHPHLLPLDVRCPCHPADLAPQRSCCPAPTPPNHPSSSASPHPPASSFFLISSASSFFSPFFTTVGEPSTCRDAHKGGPRADGWWLGPGLHVRSATSWAILGRGVLPTTTARQQCLGGYCFIPMPGPATPVHVRSWQQRCHHARCNQAPHPDPSTSCSVSDPAPAAMGLGPHGNRATTRRAALAAALAPAAQASHHSVFGSSTSEIAHQLLGLLQPQVSDGPDLLDHLHSHTKACNQHRCVGQQRTPMTIGTNPGLPAGPSARRPPPPPPRCWPAARLP